MITREALGKFNSTVELTLFMVASKNMIVYLVISSDTQTQVSRENLLMFHSSVKWLSCFREPLHFERSTIPTKKNMNTWGDARWGRGCAESRHLTSSLSKWKAG